MITKMAQSATRREETADREEKGGNRRWKMLYLIERINCVVHICKKILYAAII
jgi:hypothetical protein